MHLHENSLIKIKKFEHLFQQGHSSPLIENTLNKLAEIELYELKKNLDEISAKIILFEKKFKMSSSDFMEKFDSGILGDDADFFEWSAYADMRNMIVKKVEILEKSVK